MKTYPALRLEWPQEPDDERAGEVIATVDDFQPAAVDVAGRVMTIYFGTGGDRDSADAAVATAYPWLSRVRQTIPDEDWAARSQAALTAIDAGRLRVSPPWDAGRPLGPDQIQIVIQPSTGFGTGHHATTRLCLRLLERHVVPGARALDVGTGSGVLGIAARRLGAIEAIGLDHDPDALDNARENIALNGVDGVRAEQVDASGLLPAFADQFQVATANLTGALLCRIAASLLGTVTAGGVLIASGYQLAEREEVTSAMAAAGGTLVDALEEDGWIGGAFRRTR